MDVYRNCDNFLYLEVFFCKRVIFFIPLKLEFSTIPSSITSDRTKIYSQLRILMILLTIYFNLENFGETKKEYLALL